MLSKLYPYEYTSSVFAIDYQKLYDKGYRGIIFDIDNTLVPHGEASTPKVDRLFRHIQDIGFQTLLLSNNNEERIRLFLENIDSLYICLADKPLPRSYRKAVEMMHLRKDQVVVIGDQLFTDILGANLSGLASILVHFIPRPEETDIGKRRRTENVILGFYNHSRRYKHRIGDIYMKPAQKPKRNVIKMLLKREILFCDINPTTYKISLQKEILKRHIQNLLSKETFARVRMKGRLPNLVSSHDSRLIKTGKGIDPVLQKNKARNIDIACRRMNGLVIHPGESFSFWKLVGKTSRRNGFLDGRVIVNNHLQPGIGGGLCNLGNTIHLLILHSPMTVTEFHQHSDALAPDHGKRVPFSSGTSVSYNNIDYRFRNDTDQDVQLCLWCEKGRLYGELRSEKEFPWRYEIVEENHRFRKEGDEYYRVSKIYRLVIDRATDEVLKKELILDNHSQVMFDYDLIPQDQISEE